MIYLDHAATSFPKPASVVRAVSGAITRAGGNPGRGSHLAARLAAETVFSCREAVAALFGAPSPEQVVFTGNATAALNLVVKGLLRGGDHVLLSDLEHNAVLRPITALARAGRISYDIFPTFAARGRCEAGAICGEIERLIKPNTRLLICTHASNICSATLPLGEIGELCRRRGILFAVDAAQSAGRLPIDVGALGIDALCAPGHKGLLGPQGSGLLVLREGLRLETLIEGGSGFSSLDPEMPPDPPERYEAGTLPTPAIAGLGAGIREVLRLGVDAIGAREAQLCAYLSSLLCKIPGVTLYAPQHTGSILLFSVEGMSPDAVGRELDRLGFAVRTGYHCAPLAHKTLGTPPGGAIRVGLGFGNTEDHLLAFSYAVRGLFG